MTTRERWAIAAALLAVCLAVSAVYVLLFTTAWPGLAAGLFAAAAVAIGVSVALELGHAPELELEPLRRPERYAPRRPADPVSQWLYPDEARRLGRGDMQ